MALTNIGKTRTAGDIKIISDDIVYQGYFQVMKCHLQYSKFDGTMSSVMEREVFERGSAAAVLPYDPIKRQVVLIEQFRIGALKDVRSPWLLEVVAGILEPNETPVELIQREAREEAGIEIRALIPICQYWVSPGACTERLALFCGKVDAMNAGGIHGLAEEHEDIKVHVIPVEKAFELVHEGFISNSAAIIALQWLELNLNKIIFS